MGNPLHELFTASIFMKEISGRFQDLADIERLKNEN
jgi:hypothetical protein